MKKQVENKNIKKKYPKIRFKEFSETWEQCEVGNLFEITRGETLAKKFITNFKTRKNIYPVYSSQTTNNGLMGYYKTYLFENAITWTTDGCYAGNFNYRPEKFYSTNVNGVLISNNGYANYAVSEIINSVAQKYVTKTVNPKLMSNVVNQIKFFAPKIKEQIKISNFIFNLNNLITLHQKKLDLLKKFKKTLLEKMFSLNEESFPKIRFNGFFDAWEQCEVNKIFQSLPGEFITDEKIKKTQKR
ncbi:restriction endonuclease subunit S [Mycoplasmopsis synoviae]|uniref:restriction endonuclease subunit S n=1 Tax=Mycoplasmopsis synoviae TaxID=2109 RepID=UPI0034DB0789